MKTEQFIHHKRGAVLIVALIMLAMVTFMVVAFLAYARLDRTSVATSMRETNARLMVEAGEARVRALMRNMLVHHSPLGEPAASINVDGAGVTTEYTPAELIELQNLARPPVYVDLNGDGTYDEFRYFLNLNQDTDEQGRAIFQATTINEFGDPQWIGVLEDPANKHGADNRFIARYAYLVVPADKQLDLNRVHNKNKEIPMDNGAYPEGYQRLHGNACWELNLAGGLAMIDPKQFAYNGYVQLGQQSSFGTAFRFAGGAHLESNAYAGLWNYRYPRGDLNAVVANRKNGREFVDLLDFLKDPGLKGDAETDSNFSNYNYLFNYFTGRQSGRSFYDVMGSFTTEAAGSVTNHLSPQTMKPIIGMPPTEKLDINNYFKDTDFTLGWLSLPPAKFDLAQALTKRIAEVLLFEQPHGLTTGQLVNFNGRTNPSRSQLYEYIDQPALPGAPGYVEPDPAQQVEQRSFFVEVIDSRRVRLWGVPVRRGAALPLEQNLVRFSAYQVDDMGQPVRNGQGILMHVDDLSAPVEAVQLNVKYDLLAKKFTQLATLLLQNGMVREGANFHVGSDPGLRLFDNESGARNFGADNIQIYPPDENNLTPEVQRLLQVALNLTEVYAPDTTTRMPYDRGQLRLAWPRVFQPIVSHEAGDKVYVAGWRRVVYHQPSPMLDLPASPPASGLPLVIKPLDRLGDVPDRPWVPAAGALASTGVPPSPGIGVHSFPLLIGANKRTQGAVGGAFKIWPSVNEFSTALKWQVDPASGQVSPFLHLGVELRDNLYHTGIKMRHGGYASPLETRVIINGTVTGTLTGAGTGNNKLFNFTFSHDDLKPVGPGPNDFQLAPTISILPDKPVLPLVPYAWQLPQINSAADRRVPWRVDALRLNAEVTILCRDANARTSDLPLADWRLVDRVRLNGDADLPPQWESWAADKKYKRGDQVQVDFGMGDVKRYYARMDHTSFNFVAESTRWKLAEWAPGETFNQNDVIRCVNNSNGQANLYRCLRRHTTPNGGVFLPSLKTPQGEPLWALYRGEVYEMSWQVNDPLVNGAGRDYTLTHPMEPNTPHPRVPVIKYLYDSNGNWTSNNLGQENLAFRPWNVANSLFKTPTPDDSRPWADSYDHIMFKDPGMFTEQSWMFPHKSVGGLETLGWLGLVHRGTPWQTVYLKSKPANRLLVQSIDPVSGIITAGEVPFFWQGDRVQLQGGPPDYQGFDGNIRYDGSSPPFTLTLWDATFTINKLATTVGYTHDPADPSTWMYLTSNAAWHRQTGTVDTRPTNDHRLVDVFSTSPSLAARTSLLSVNAESPAAWAAVLSGVAVPLSKKKEGAGNLVNNFYHRKHPGNCTEEDCARFDLRLAPNPSMRALVKSINEHRQAHGGDQPVKRFERVSDILSVPGLTAEQPVYRVMIQRREAERAAAPRAPGEWAPYYPDELDYERIPQQILSLLRTDGTPRFVAYVFSQTLKPARGALDDDGLCSNYTIDREAARRTVFRIEGMEKWREYHYLKKSGLTPTPPPSPRMVVESSAPLKLR